LWTFTNEQFSNLQINSFKFVNSLKQIVRFQPVGHLLRRLDRVSKDEGVRNVPAAQLRPDVRHFLFGVVIVFDRTPVITRTEIESEFAVEATNAIVVSFANLK
jgi:hypothetical protein